MYNQVYSNYSIARKADWERLDSMTSAARTISRHGIRSPTAISEEASLYKFMTIPCDTTHTLHTALSACAQRRFIKVVHLKQSRDEQVHLHQGQDEQVHLHQGQDEQVHLHQGQDEQVHLHQGQDEQVHLYQCQDEQVHLHQGQDEQVQELIFANSNPAFQFCC